MIPLIRAARAFVRRKGWDLVRYRHRPGGMDAWQDIANILKDKHTDPVVFDVGANIGQSTLLIRQLLPSAIIHSFEPSPSTFKELQQRVGDDNRANLWNVGVGSTNGALQLLENSQSDMSSFLVQGSMGWGRVTRQTQVPVVTVDRFCRSNGIGYVHLLKSDTQGYDLEVLRGAQTMLASSRVGLIYVEFMFCELYKNQPSLAVLLNFLKDYGFELVGIYHQRYLQGRLGTADLLFIHSTLQAARTDAWSTVRKSYGV